MQITSLDDAAWDSPWRHRRVGEKVALSTGLLLTSLCTPEVLVHGAPIGVWPGALMVAVVSVVVIVRFAHIQPRVLWQAMAAPIVFLVIGGISVLISVGTSTGGPEWWRAGGVSIGPASAAQAASLVEHGLGGTLAVMVLGVTTPMVDLLTWLRTFHIPDPLLEISSLTYRLIFVLLGTFFTAQEAQRNRLSDDVPSRKRRWENTAALLGSVAVRSWNRAERLNDGLTNRGFESSLVTLTMPRRASTKLMVSTVVSLVAIWAITWATTGRLWR